LLTHMCLCHQAV